MNKSDYQKYLASREWATLKEKVRHRSKGICERCLRGKHEATHHLTYERIGKESINDLIGICVACHEYLSAKSSIDPREITNQEVTSVQGQLLKIEAQLSQGLIHSRNLNDLQIIKAVNKIMGDLLLLQEAVGDKYDRISFELFREAQGLN